MCTFIIKKGGNYGWNTLEGTHCFLDANCDKSNLIAPVHEYGRTLGRSVTGGYVYRGSDEPNFSGVYFFADFLSGKIFGLEKLANKWVATEVLDTEHLISAFGQDKDGELYLMSYGEGKVFRLAQ